MRRRRRAQSRMTRTNRDENSVEPFKTKFTHLLSSFICCCQCWCRANERAELDIALLIHPRPMVKSTIYKHIRFKANFNDRRWRMHHIIQLTSKNQLLFKAIRQNSYLKKKKKKEWTALMSQLWAWGPLMKRHLHGQWSMSTRKAAGSLGSGIVWIQVLTDRTPQRTLKRIPAKYPLLKYLLHYISSVKNEVINITTPLNLTRSRSTFFYGPVLLICNGTARRAPSSYLKHEQFKKT